MEQSIEKSIKQPNQSFTFCFLKGAAIGIVLSIGMGDISVGIVTGLCLAFLMGIIAKKRA